MPKVSVIIPNYNHAKFLEQRIESVIHQTYQDFEIIFLDDASTDNSREVFAKYANHPKISHIIFNESNSGSPFRQWNKGVNLAKGEYIWIAESDDYCELNFLELLVFVLNSNVNIGVVYSESVKVSENDTRQIKLSSSFYEPERWKHNFSGSGIIECSLYLSSQCTIPNASAVLFRSCLYNTENLISVNATFQVAGDWFTWSYILLSPSDIYFLAQNLNYFRYHDSNTSIDNQKVGVIVEESLRVFNFISERVKIPITSKQNAFKTIVLRWWLGYLLNQQFSIKNEFFIYLKILNSFPEVKFLILLNIKLIYLLFVKLRYILGVRTRISKLTQTIFKTFSSE